MNGTDVTKSLRPGQRGTKKPLKTYGKQLVCVRCRHEEAAGVRLKTVEIVVAGAKLERPRSLPPSALASVKAEPWEKPLQERLPKGGARWDPGLRLSRMRYDAALSLGLKRRILKSLPRPESSHR